MSNASSAFPLKLSLGFAGAKKFFEAFGGIKLPAGLLALATLLAQSAQAAPSIYVPNYLDGTVSVLDAATGAPILTTPITVGTSPLCVLMNSAGTTVYVTNYGDGTVSVINTSTNTALATPIVVGAQPQYMSLSPDDKTLYVTDRDGGVSFVNTTTNTLTGTVQVGNFPVGSGLTPNGSTLYVSESSVGKVAVIDTATSTITTTVNVGDNPLAVKVSPDGTLAYVVNYYSDTISVINTSNNTVVATIPVDAGPHDVAFNPAGTFAYVTAYLGGVVDVINTSTNLVIAQIPVGTAASTSTGPLGIAIDSRGTFGYVSNSVEDNLSIIDLTTNVVVSGTFATGGTPAYLAIGSYASLPLVNLDQHGLTGTWYEPTTSGQGFIFEVSPDVNGAGKGFLSGGWFTYDTAASGGQRWYTVQGAVSNSNGVANLGIYTATGGGFNSATPVTSLAVGTVTLQFTDCLHGLLTYSFSDGSNRVGSIPLQRLTPNTTCGQTGDNGAAPGNFLLSGAWYDPATNGQGFSFDINPALNLLSAAWYTFAPSGQQINGGTNQVWYTLQTTQFPAGATAVSSVPIYATSGGIFHNPAAVTSSQVGTANVQFNGCNALVVAYNLTSGTNVGSGTINMVRPGATPAGCQ